MPITEELSPEELALLDHSTRGPMLMQAHWSLMAFASLFLAARLYVKLTFKRGLWWDDWILIGGWIAVTTTCTLTTILVHDFGLGHHSYDLIILDTRRFFLILDSRATTTLTAVSLTKTAFAVSLLRLTTQKTKAFVWFLIITLNITMCVSAMIPWIQCKPLNARWDPDVKGECWDNKVGTKIWIATGAQSSLYDFVLAALPWTFLYSITLRTREKVGVLVAMSMGAVAGAVGIVKCIKLPFLGAGDSYDEVDLFVWDVAESTVTIMAACIPTLRVFLREKTSSGPSNERSTRLSQFSLSFRSAGRNRRMFDSQDIEVIRETRVSKEEVYTGSGASRDGGSASGSGSGSGSGTGKPMVVEKSG
ncbi:hypothetical protein QBC34DRAFT_496314 [Podospora aff. communis PSN243]|uniref:Rhodopsin domain-containing protein n=1 Tax=Podospora aff. communis PSN243 TaxID=3040156 RepID=A0AAV9GIN7_9PEZI|nr:hypothetical protein QBC34DRAFT_496314 [Podospora aff. communis PSN243]